MLILDDTIRGSSLAALSMLLEESIAIVKASRPISKSCRPRKEAGHSTSTYGILVSLVYLPWFSTPQRLDQSRLL